MVISPTILLIVTLEVLLKAVVEPDLVKDVIVHKRVTAAVALH